MSDCPENVRKCLKNLECYNMSMVIKSLTTKEGADIGPAPIPLETTMGIYDSTGKPSISKFRCRLEVIRKASASGGELAQRWNPKGRNFKVQRDMIRFFADAEKQAIEYLGFLQR